MSAIDTAIRRIKTIPKEVLQQAFMPIRYDPTRNSRYYDNTLPISLDAVIRDQVIMGRVFPDIDLISGSEVYIKLTNSKYEMLDAFNSIYRFSDQETGGRTITSPIEITYGSAISSLPGQHGGYGTGTSRSSQYLKVAASIIRSSTGTQPRSTSYIQMIGHNTILVNDVTPIANYGILRCIVGNEPNLSNIRPQYQQVFAELCLYAAQAFIYTNLLIDIDESQLRGGQTIGRFREVVDSYADADRLYIEQLDKWQKIGMMNDPVQYRKVLRTALGNRPKY